MNDRMKFTNAFQEWDNCWVFTSVCVKVYKLHKHGGFAEIIIYNKIFNREHPTVQCVQLVPLVSCCGVYLCC